MKVVCQSGAVQIAIFSGKAQVPLRASVRFFTDVVVVGGICVLPVGIAEQGAIFFRPGDGSPQRTIKACFEFKSVGASWFYYMLFLILMRTFSFRRETNSDC